MKIKALVISIEQILLRHPPVHVEMEVNISTQQFALLFTILFLTGLWVKNHFPSTCTEQITV